MLNWKRHYTGISTAEYGRLYLKRNTKTEKLQFIRYRFTGVFLRRGNYLKNGIFEFFTRKWHAGLLRKFTKPYIRWSGSFSDPYCTVMFHIAWFGIGRRTPKFLKTLKENRVTKYWEDCPFPDWEV